MIAWSSIATGLSMAFFPAISWLVLSLDFEIELFGTGFLYRPWRLLCLVFAAPAVVAAIMLMMYPESPKYFVTIVRRHASCQQH